MRNIFLFLSFFPTMLCALGFESLVSDFEKQGLSNSSWAIAVYSISGKKIYSKNENKKLIPGSSVKLFSTAFAFDCLGPQYQIKTELYGNGDMASSQLNGDLVLKGYGDITFGSDNFGDSYYKKAKEIYSILNEKGIKKINGSIFVDSSFYSFTPPGSWAWEDIGNYYASFPWAFSVNDNSYKLCFKEESKEGSPLEISSIEPDLRLDIENLAITSPKKSGDNSYIYSIPWIRQIRITGSAPAGYCIKGSMPYPASFFSSYLREYLISSGIEVKGEALSGIYAKPLDENKLMKVFYSPSLKEITAFTNKKSFNLYAEGIYKLASMKCSKGDNPLNDFAHSFKASIHSADACGLSRLNLFSALDFIRLLNFVAANPYYKEYRDTLYYPGDPLGRGHIRNLDKEGVMGRNLAIKSGSLKYVRSYAGYLRTKRGNELSFAFIINNYEVSPRFIDKVHSSLIKWLYDNK